jgi:integrase
MARQDLTARKIESLRPAAKGKRVIIMDAQAPGLGIRVTDKGHKTFVFGARFPGKKFHAFREIDGVAGLAEARVVARQWRVLIERGEDPAVVKAREEEEKRRKRAITFSSVAEAWFREKLSTERRGEEAEDDLRKIFMPAWGERPIAEITNTDVREIIKLKKQTAPGRARNLLGTIRRFFSWAIEEDCYGLTASPCDRINPTKLFGKKRKGQRILDEAELFALWRAAKRMPYPFGPVYQTLMLTALRLNEAARARSAEFDWGNNSHWTIPAERMKGTNESARPHAVPLTHELSTIVQSLPRFKGGIYLFSCTGGKKPVWIGNLVKKRIDRRMLRTLRALARRDGRDPAAVELPRWTNHDIRRTVRSNLSRLKVAEEVREAVLAHVRPGIKGTYDLYDYFDEKREALELWAARLRSIVDPPPSNVVPLRQLAATA